MERIRVWKTQSLFPKAISTKFFWKFGWWKNARNTALR